MARFFVDPAVVAGEVAMLVGPDAHHAATVLRLKLGAAVTLLDGLGGVFSCEVQAIAKGQVTLGVMSRAVVPAPAVEVTLYQGLPKGDKLELVLQKATELGVARVVPLPAVRSVMKVEAGKVEAKLARWRAIAREAAEQSERPTLPVVDAPRGLAGLTLPAGTRAYVLAERTGGRSLPRALPPAPPPPLALFVGPEGGWDPVELAQLEALGAEPVTLGPRILRTETAGLAALAIVMAAYEL